MSLTPSRYSKFTTGTIAFEFELPGVDGKNHKLSEFKGKKAVLIIFMCNHCPYVIPKFEYFNELYEKYRPKGLEIIAISSNDSEYETYDSFENMKLVSKKEGFKFNYLFDENQEVAKKFDATCTPDPFLLDSSLKLVYHGRFDDAHGENHKKAKTSEMEDAIKEVLKGKTISVQSLPSMGCNIKWK